MDRLNRAKDAITGKVPSHEDPVVAAALDAELEAEKQAVTEEVSLPLCLAFVRQGASSDMDNSHA